MVEIFVRPDQRTEAAATLGSNRARIWTMVVACMGVLLVIASMVALNTALGDVAVATSASQSQLTWVVDCYSVALACLLLPAGAIGDRYGRRGAFLFDLAAFAVASLASKIFTNPWQLIAARGVAGVGAAFIMPATLSLLTATHREDERAKAVGIWAGVAGSGAVIGMLGSGALLHFWSWRSIFWAFAGFAALIFVLACSVSSSRDEEATPLDWAGAGLIAGVVAVFVFGMLEAPARGWSHPLVSGSMGAGAVLAVAFGFVEVRRRHPPARCSAVPQTGLRHRIGHDHSLFHGDVRVLFRHHAIHPAGNGLQPDPDRLRAGPADGADPDVVGAIRVVSAADGSAAGGVHRPAAHLGRVPVDACPADRLAVLGHDVATDRDEYWHRILHGARHVNDHGGSPRREAEGRLGRQRHHPGGRCSPRHSARGVHPGGAVWPRHHTASGSLPRPAVSTGLPFARSGAGDLQNAWPAGWSTRRPQPVGLLAGHGVVVFGARGDHRRISAADQRLGPGPRWPTAALGATDHLAPARRRPRLTSPDELRRAMPEHHDAGVRTAAGNHRQDRAVDHPQAVDAAHATA
jgi:Major Facilitator Superfamily